MSRSQIWPLDAATYEPHRLHTSERAWKESNCYIDVWVEVLHAMRVEPMACLPFVLPVDFEGDQWTFFKPSHDDLRLLYGVEVQELNVWRPLVHHAVEHVGAGRVVLTESDAFWLPDTAGTDYRRQHTKTTIGIQAIDVAARKLGYFHNAGYYELEGEDFAETFRLDKPLDPTFMPLFAEFAKVMTPKHLSARELTETSIAILRRHLALRPKENPIARFRKRFETDLEWLRGEGLATYHAYAFGTLRQCGAAFELVALHLRWLGENGEQDLGPIAEDFDLISNNAKAMILKGARAVNSKKPLDTAPMLGAMESSWHSGMERLVSRYG